MIHSRIEACRILGVRLDASPKAIKKEFKNLVKCYHPDSRLTGNTTIYNRVMEAYEYLCDNPLPNPCEDVNPSAIHTTNVHYWTSGMGTSKINPQPNYSSPKIIGNPSQGYRRGSNYESFEKKYKQQRTAKNEETYRKLDEYAREMKRREEEYRQAMDAINSIRVAEAIKALIRSRDE